MIELYTYEEMKQMDLPQDILEDMRHFNYARYDSFEGFDCFSLEILDYKNLIISRGSVLFYLTKGKVFCFTSKKELLMDLFETVKEKYPEDRFLYGFLAEVTREDEFSFESIEKEIMALEEALILEGKRNCVFEIVDLRKRLMILKRYYEQFLTFLDILIENENNFFDHKNLRSFKMLYRRTERRFQNVLNLRESVTQVRESYEAEVDINLNQTMKLFTVVTTIFLPLTLIVGWYGMNFQMPEYEWKYGYSFVTAASVFFVLLGVLFFRKKKWF